MNLPNDALTKEIQLTQELLELFTEHQIPPDLLAATCEEAHSDKVLLHAEEWEDVGNPMPTSNIADQQALVVSRRKKTLSDKKLEEVRQNVKSVAAVIDAQRQQEVTQQRMRNDAKEPTEKNSASLRASRSLERGCRTWRLRGCATKSLASRSRTRGRAADTSDSSDSDDSDSDDSNSDSDCSSTGDARSAPAVGDESDPQALRTAEGPPDDVNDNNSSTTASVEKLVDYTQIPRKLGARLEAVLGQNKSSCVRPTIIKVRDSGWWKRAPAGFFLKKTPERMRLSSEELKCEKNAAFDLLDALTRGGALPVEDCALHVVIASTHCFDQALIETVSY